jgi:2-polyprenyl-3-methyl-5-hydroxy-6-metoxy-1,4-benzoquinol methylase
MIYESINIPLWRLLKPLQGRRILDVGCGTGALGELLQRNGNYVAGITHSRAEAWIAQERIASVKVLDLNKHVDVDVAILDRYDAILFGDVLEHLIDPTATLKLFLNKLEHGGRIYVSLPNIACFYIRLGLLFGQFNRSKYGGILDETHLHFYTLKSARFFLKNAGLEIEKIDFVPAPSVWLYQAFFKKNPELTRASASEKSASSTLRKDTSVPEKMSDRGIFQFYEKYLYPVEHTCTWFWRTMFANQFVFVCKRPGE